MDLVRRLAELLQPSGLQPRGVFARDDRPGSGVLIGHVGGAFWPVFAAWRADNSDVPDPLDTWSRGVIDAVAAETGGQGVYPNDRPYWPFQRWAMEAEGLRAGPLGVLMHPVAGPWHAYRGAILFPSEISIQLPQAMIHPCENCVEKPCLTACPVSAISMDRLNVTTCRAHLAASAGHACVDGGCLARNACPAGANHRYSPDQLRFHMAAFARL